MYFKVQRRQEKGKKEKNRINRKQISMWQTQAQTNQ